jgi:FtsP/CotA-like multicopper oxidase with cupredoxin domain
LTSAGLLIPKRAWGGLGDRNGEDAPSSPPTAPFKVELPRPPIAGALTSLDPMPAAKPVAGEADRAPHQFWNDFIPKTFYDIHIAETQHRFHPELPLTTVWGFNGNSPGPTFHAHYGEPIVVRFHNDLPRNHVGFGTPQVTIHLHNGHTAPESDGFPGDFYDSGLFKDQHYLNAFPGFSAGDGGDPNEAMGTLWYHDHRAEFTAQNVYRGLTGAFLLFDELDSGDENDPNPKALRLPSGDFDIPLVLADKLFDPDGQMFFDPFNLDGILGDKFIVNGAIQPFLEVARRKYRFRIINTGPSRFYQLFLSSGQSFCQISNDGNLLPVPHRVDSVRLSVAERVDVVIDFSACKAGEQIVLVNRLEQTSGRGPTGKLLSPGDAIMRFDVVGDKPAADPSRVPDVLRPLPVFDPKEAVQTRSFRFERKGGAWAINDQFFDLGRVDATVKRGSAEIWGFENHSGGWSHPIHIHQEEFRILSRNGVAPPAVEVGRKDVMWLGHNEVIQTFRRFRDFLGRYPIHCHNVIHEDHAMMTIFEVID